ncbi:hypothetical protein HYU14_05260 [Candidatus Woesearchaeota archaeon]|nr:hypothetical protein [Candidatus Woesearchaeota archaeon]
MATQHEVRCDRLEKLAGTTPFGLSRFVILTNEGGRNTFVACPYYSSVEFTCGAPYDEAKQDVSEQHRVGYYRLKDVGAQAWNALRVAWYFFGEPPCKFTKPLYEQRRREKQPKK